MTFTAQTSQSQSVGGVDAGSRDDTPDAPAFVRRANEAVSWALTSSDDAEASRTLGGDAPQEAPTRLADRTGNHASVAPVFSLPPGPSPESPRSTLHALQEWEGYVVEILTDELVVRLVDLTAGSTHEEEEATIPLAEIAEGDAAAMRVGSIFRWVIGYERSPAGTKKRVSQIVFRDLPRMTEQDFQEGKKWARETMRAFDR
ncbi:MAG: hypothetical protein OXH69_05290 [Acidobacteria bacterium]|nr:hypothetical protein [Acidobacteriota bacterium]